MLKTIIPKIIGNYLELKSILFPSKTVDQAFKLFCTPRKGKTKPKHQEFFSTAVEEKHQICEHSIATYHWQGSGATILLLHGWESNSYRWHSLVKLLQVNHFNIIAVDAPAQGNSSGKYLNVPLYTKCAHALIEKYNPSIMVGHSLGGMTAIYAQYLKRNAHIKKIVALGPPSELALFLKGFQDTLGFSAKFMTKFDAYLMERFGFRAKDFSVSKFAKSLQCAGLLILEEKDQLAPFKYSKRIAENWEACELYSVNGIGHSLQSKKIDQRILDFLKEADRKTVSKTSDLVNTVENKNRTQAKAAGN